MSRTDEGTRHVTQTRCHALSFEYLSHRQETTMRCWLQGMCVAGLAALAAACGTRSPSPGTVQDEAMRAGLTPEHFRAATEDYFHGMDFNVVDGHPIRPFTQAEVQGRNMWLVWTAGDDRLWDRLTRDSLG